LEKAGLPPDPGTANIHSTKDPTALADHIQKSLRNASQPGVVLETVAKPVMNVFDFSATPDLRWTTSARINAAAPIAAQTISIAVT
jgi:hypothetical protein